MSPVRDESLLKGAESSFIRHIGSVNKLSLRTDTLKKIMRHNSRNSLSKFNYSGTTNLVSYL